MVTQQYVYQQSIVSEMGSIETRVNNGAQLNHKGDAITYRGMQPMQNYPDTYGTILRITHTYNDGDISKMPEDYVLELKPNQSATVRNLERVDGAPGYDVLIRCEGPLFDGGVYQGYKVEPVPDENGIPEASTPRGPFMSILMGRPFFQRFLGRG